MNFGNPFTEIEKPKKTVKLLRIVQEPSPLPKKLTT